MALLHGAGPRLVGLSGNARMLSAALGEGSVLRAYDAAAPIGVVRQVVGLLGDRPFGYAPEDLARSSYDWAGARRIHEDIVAYKRTTPHGGLVLIGHSLGAAMAVDLVNRLARQDIRIEEVLLLDRMFFEWRWGAFLGLRRRMHELAPRGAEHIEVLHEVLVHKESLPLRERIWVSAPAGGHVPLPDEVARRAGCRLLTWAPPEYGHGAVAWWPDPFQDIVRRRTGRAYSATPQATSKNPAAFTP